MARGEPRLAPLLAIHDAAVRAMVHKRHEWIRLQLSPFHPRDCPKAGSGSELNPETTGIQGNLECVGTPE